MPRALISTLLKAALGFVVLAPVALPLASPAAAAAPAVKRVVGPAWSVVHPGSGLRPSAPRANAALQPKTATNSQLVLDPGFEAGPPWPAWTQSSYTGASPGGRTLIDTRNPHSGTYSAHLCQATANCDDAVYQPITVPPRVLSATLTYSFYVGTQEPPTACGDSLGVGLTDSNFNSASDSGRKYCSDWNGQPYTADTIDETSFLQGHANQTVELVAVGTSDGNNLVSDYNVDDFALTITYATGPADPYMAVSQRQYTLTGSNGTTWTDMDTTNLALNVTPSTDSQAVISGNSDLWTAAAGVNQDIGIMVSGGGAYPRVAGQPEAWKESGGFAGTFSPNAAFVQTVIPLSGGVTYNVKLGWKSNHPTGATIFAAAGPFAPFSPTRLAVQLVPNAGSGSANAQAAYSQAQYELHGSNGTSWVPLGAPVVPSASGHDASPTLTLSPTVNGSVILGANADLWTKNAGVNQDLAINASGGAFSTGQIVAWKESGGFAGTFSPNAAFVKTVVPVTAGQTYTFGLLWKANHPTGGSIMAGAGSILGNFSPTTLTAQFVPNSAGVQDATSTLQYQLWGSDGAGWFDIDSTNLVMNITPPADCVAVLSGNADLWTENAGFNQDIGIQLSWPGHTLTPDVVGWKESGGFAGTFSPNAAFVQSVIPLSAGVTYTAKLQWKANKASPSNAIIVAGAGPGPNPPFSPTRLTSQLLCPQHLAITTGPQTLTAGSASSPITVQLLDAWGNPVNAGTAGQPVTLSSTSNTGSFTPVSPITIPPGSSSTSFTYADTTSGTPTIRVTAPGLAGASQQETVNPGPASTMTMTAPTTAVHGVAFNLTVTLKDQYGNVATGYGGTVKFTTTDPSGTINGTAFALYGYQFVPGDAGSHTFSVILNTIAPAATITATDTVTLTLTATSVIAVS